MSACPVTIHGLLHIADGIEATGPVWAAWAFVMERYCGWVKRSAVRSRKHALTSIDNRVLETTQLEMAKMRYGLTKKLSLKPKRGRTSKAKFSNCMSISPAIPICGLTTLNRPRVCNAGPETDSPCRRRSHPTAHRFDCNEVQPGLCRSKDTGCDCQKICSRAVDRVGRCSNIRHW